MDGLVGASLAIGWLNSFTGSTPIGVGSGYAVHILNGRHHIVYGAERIRTAAGYSVLAERGEVDQVSGPRYLILRLAGFNRAGPALSTTPPPSSAFGGCGQLQRRDWGVEFVVIGEAARRLRELPIEHLGEELAKVAAALELEPIYESASANELPAGALSAVPVTGERTIRCSHCGAPVAGPASLALVGGACPYCGAPVVVPPQIASEIEGYQRSLFAIDARYALQGERLWQTVERATCDGTPILCAVCGGPVSQAARVENERCEYCGALIVPGAERLREGRGAARVQGLQAEGRRRAKEREDYDRARAGTKLFTRGLLAFWVLGGIVLLVALLPRISLARRSDLLWVVAPMVVLNGAPLLGLAWVSRDRKRIGALWSAAWSRLAEQLGATAIDQPGGWFARFWSAATKSAQELSGAGPSYGVLEGQMAEVPFLIRGSVDAGMNPWSTAERSLRIYVAVDWTDETALLKSTPGIRERRRQLAAAGFRSCIRRRGLEISADIGTLGRLRREPEHIAIVAPVLAEVVRIAVLIGGTPVRG